MATLYTELRKEMKRKGVQGHDVACWLNLSDQSVSQRMTGIIAWSLPEMYIVMDKLRIPLHKLHIVFPKEGMWAGPLEDPPPSRAQQLASLIDEMVREAAGT